MKERARETEVQLVEFKRKNDQRWRAILIIASVFWLTASIWGSIFFQEYLFWILGIVLGGIFCTVAIMAPSLERWWRARPNYVPPPPAGWSTVASSILLGLLWLFLGIRQIISFLKHGASDPSGFIEIITILPVILIYIVGTFIVSLPQAIRSVSLHFAVPNDFNRRAIPMICWRGESFNQIMKRVCKNRAFKRLLAKLPFAPNAPMKLMFHEKYLNLESTPTQEGVGSRSVITVIIKDEESPLE